MEADDAFINEMEEHIPRRSLRLALAEINEHILGTPKSTSPDEMIIIQRGPRKKPLTWSPVEYSRTKIIAPSRDKTPEPVSQRCEINPRLRRRLVLSPSKGPSQELLGIVIAKKLRALKNLDKSFE